MDKANNALIAPPIDAQIENQVCHTDSTKQAYRSKMRSGFAMLEIVIGIAIVSLIIAAAVVYGPKMMVGRKSDIGFASFKSIDTALVDVYNSNGAAYPSGTGAISTTTSLYNALGGATATKDLTGWTYSCTAGSGKTMTIVTTPFESAEVQSSLVDKINGRALPWTAAASGTNAVTITKTNVTCN
ncbi:MAG: type II secretion system protein [Paludibacter sp.]|nr:type II secretion system protein [Paludibacter sp.]